MEKVGLIGAGGQAREVEQYLREYGVHPSFYAVDKEYVAGDKRIDILSPNEFEEMTPVISAIGSPEVRRKMVESWKGEEFYSVVSKDAYIGEGVRLGSGVIVAPRAVLTTDIEVGDHVLINVAATVSHDVKLGNYVTIGPGAHIGGSVELGDGVFVGIGANVSNGIKVAEGSVIGAGAVVISDIMEPNSVVVGVPAKLIRINEGWLSEV